MDGGGKYGALLLLFTEGSHARRVAAGSNCFHLRQLAMARGKFEQQTPFPFFGCITALAHLALTPTADKYVSLPSRLIVENYNACRCRIHFKHLNPDCSAVHLPVPLYGRAPEPGCAGRDDPVAAERLDTSTVDTVGRGERGPARGRCPGLDEREPVVHDGRRLLSAGRRSGDSRNRQRASRRSGRCRPGISSTVLAAPAHTNLPSGTLYRHSMCSRR